MFSFASFNRSAAVRKWFELLCECIKLRYIARGGNNQTPTKRTKNQSSFASSQNKTGKWEYALARRWAGDLFTPAGPHRCAFMEIYHFGWAVVFRCCACPGFAHYCCEALGKARGFVSAFFRAQAQHRDTAVWKWAAFLWGYILVAMGEKTTSSKKKKTSYVRKLFRQYIKQQEAINQSDIGREACWQTHFDRCGGDLPLIYRALLT